MQHESLRGTLQRVLHLAGLAAGWVLFFYWWYLVAVSSWKETEVALLIAVTLVVSPLITFGWIAHNLGIFRRRGPRLAQPAVETTYANDWNGCRVEADWQALREATHVTVTVEGGSKRYVGIAPTPT